MHFLLSLKYSIEMSFLNKKNANRRNQSTKAAVTIAILAVTALSLALAPSTSMGLIRTAHAEPSSVHPTTKFIATDDPSTDDSSNGNAGDGATDVTPDTGNNNGDTSGTDNSDAQGSTDNSWCYNQGTVTDESGNERQITSCWNSQQECQDMQMVDQEASGDCFENPNAQPDQSSHNSWCYAAGPDPVEDQSCWDSQQQCEQVQMADTQATTECSEVMPSAPQA